MSSDVYVAHVGVVGVLVGSVSTALLTFLTNHFQMSEKRKIDETRKKLLKEALGNLEHKEGRSLDTLVKITGAEPTECRRLLIQINARGFTLKDGREGWCYIKDRPLTRA